MENRKVSLKSMCEGVASNIIYDAIKWAIKTFIIPALGGGLIVGFVKNLDFLGLRVKIGFWAVLVYVLLFFAIFMFVAMMYKFFKNRKLAYQKELDNRKKRKIYIANGYKISYPEDRVEEYSFTIVNETDEDIKDVYISIDDIEHKAQKRDKWMKLIPSNFISDTLVWENQEGKSEIDIDSGCRVMFHLGRLTWEPVYNVKTKDYFYNFDFILSLISKADRIALIIDHFHRLLLTINAKDSHGNRFQIRYYIYLTPRSRTGGKGGVQFTKIKKRTNDSSISTLTYSLNPHSLFPALKNMTMRL